MNIDNNVTDDIIVFISYSHDSEEHKQWVAKLAAHLQRHVNKVILDQWDLRLGGDLRFFMEQGLSSSAIVLCICSETYVHKADAGEGGAGYESMIMTQPLLKNANSEFIIPVIRNNKSSQKTPLAFGSKLYIDFSNDNNYYNKYAELIERICGEDIKKRPNPGKNPFTMKMAEQIFVKTNIDSIKYYSPEKSGGVTFHFDNNNGVYILGSGEYTFYTRWSRAGNNSIHAYGNIGFLPILVDYPEYNELINLNYSSTSRVIQTGQIVVWQNEQGKFAAIKLGKVKSSVHGFPYDEMNFEYKIYSGI